MSKNARWPVAPVDSATLRSRYGEAYAPQHSEGRKRAGSAAPRAAIWTVLGLTKQYWYQALENAQFFTKNYLEARDEIDEPRLDAALHKAWGAEYETNYDAALGYLQTSGRQFWHARDDDGHAFKNMPMMWQAALAASQQTQPSAQP